MEERSTKVLLPSELILALVEREITSMGKKVIFIDDREENLKNVEVALQTLPTPISYQGLLFTGAINYPSQAIPEEQFEEKWQKLADEASVFTIE